MKLATCLFFLGSPHPTFAGEAVPGESLAAGAAIRARDVEAVSLRAALMPLKNAFVQVYGRWSRVHAVGCKRPPQTPATTTSTSTHPPDLFCFSGAPCLQVLTPAFKAIPFPAWLAPAGETPGDIEAGGMAVTVVSPKLTFVHV